MSAKSKASGFHGDKLSGGRDGGSGGADVRKGGTGYLTKSTSSKDGTVGAKGAPDNSARGFISKAKSADGTARISDGVGKALPSA